jgi:hypothetical protein
MARKKKTVKVLFYPLSEKAVLCYPDEDECGPLVE